MILLAESSNSFNPVFFVIGLALFLGFTIFGWMRRRKRSSELEVVAGQLGLSFNAASDPALSRRFRALQHLHQGGSHWAWNVMQGTWQGQPVLLCDYRFDKTETNNDTPQPHYYHIATVELPRACPTLIISPENIFEKVAAAVGFEDINFESAEFSRKFWVTSTDKKFAYDFCNAQMIEFLLADPQLFLQVDGTTLAVIRRGQRRPEAVRAELDGLVALRQRLPDYLFADA